MDCIKSINQHLLQDGSIKSFNENFISLSKSAECTIKGKVLLNRGFSQMSNRAQLWQTQQNTELHEPTKEGWISQAGKFYNYWGRCLHSPFQPGANLWVAFHYSARNCHHNEFINVGKINGSTRNRQDHLPDLMQQNVSHIYCPIRE